jgi:putative cardiolipin synthase
VRAADRGVRVRVLLDDINTESDVPIAAALDVHPNIEVRIFNPFANRGARLFDFALDLDRVNHRMHNKLLVADNAVAIVGGRNIGNHYFGVATDANFRDLDIAAAGPVVRDASTVFDHFWNSDWAVPVSALLERPYTDADLTSIRDKFIWAPGKIVWDDPNDIKAGVEHGRLDKAFYRKLDTLQKELLIESAYFVAGDRGVAKARELHDRGIRMRVLTNSLASNDVVAAHAGYAKYREALLANGVELYELRPDAGAIKKKVLSGESKAALHTKAIVFDREAVFIGSFNLDPRSANLNTEAGLYVESPELAAQVIAYMDEGVRPENSYRVMLDEDGHLVWETEINGMAVIFHQDPETGFWDRFMSGFIGLLPVEHQL